MRTVLEHLRQRLASRWDFYAAALLCAWTLLLVPSWPRLPYFMDAYYHFSVMRGFLDAGGWVGSAFWEAAPVGRPHLYPPLFHFLGCAVLGAGAPVLFVARLFAFLIYPLFLLVFWRGARRLTSDRTAFLFLLMLAASVPLYISIENNMPFSLAMLFGFGAVLSHRRGRWRTAGILLAAAFYTHTLMAVVTALAFFLAAGLEARKGGRRATASLVLGGVLAAPFLWHQVAFHAYYAFRRTLEFSSAQISIPLYFLALAGVARAWRRGDGGRAFVVLYAAMAVLWVTNRDRLLSGQGLVPVCFFAAAALDDVWERVAARRPVGRWIFWVLLVGLFFMATPMIGISVSAPGDRARVKAELSSPLRDLGGVEGVGSVKGKSLYHPRFVRELVDLVKERTRPEDILYSNFPYAGGMVAVLAHRATSNVMLAEVRPWASFDAGRAARWVIWFKEGSLGETVRNPPDFLFSSGLVEVAETDLAWFFENPAAPTGRRVIPAAWTWPLVAAAAFLGFGVCFWEALEPAGRGKNRG
jgi:hypothetical protein